MDITTHTYKHMHRHKILKFNLKFKNSCQHELMFGPYVLKHGNTLEKIIYKLKTTESWPSRNQQVIEEFPFDFLNCVLEIMGSFTQ